MNNVEKISPFKNFCITIGNLPTSYLESMSYYEMLCWFCKYLENTINPAINNNAEALEELQQYVANYFDNLDVSEEINAKLDEMVQDGTMAEIINQEIFTELSGRVTTVENELKLNHVHTITLSEITDEGEIIDQFYNGSIAWNSDSSWYKCFFYMRVVNDGTTQTIHIPLPNGFNVSTGYYISNAGEVWASNGSFFGTVQLLVEPTGFKFTFEANGTYYIKFNPYIYYNGVIES